jgi:isochorismate hydrolase
MTWRLKQTILAFYIVDMIHFFVRTCNQNEKAKHNMLSEQFQNLKRPKKKINKKQ